MIRKNVIYIRFNDNDLALKDRFHVESLSRDWIAKRFDFFYKYTRKSIEAQTDQEFITVLRVHPKTVPIVNSVISNYPKLPENMFFSATPKEVIKSYVAGADEFYISHIDSDDLYHPDYIKILREMNPLDKTSIILPKYGYIYDFGTDRLCGFPSISSAFFTQRFLVRDYFDTYQYYPELHHLGAYLFPYEPFPDHKFMVLTNGRNTVTTVNKYLPHLIEDEAEKEDILKLFHVK